MLVIQDPLNVNLPKAVTVDILKCVVPRSLLEMTLNDAKASSQAVC